MLNLKQCFFIIYKYTKLFKKKYPQGDGLAFWRNIKPILEKYDDNTSEWVNGDLHKKYFNIAMNTQEECILGNGNKKINAPNHFFIQIFRIPTKDPLNARKLCQIALNLGQLEISLNKDNFNKDLLKKLKNEFKNNDFSNINNFIDDDNLLKIDISKKDLLKIKKVLMQSIVN